MMVNCVRNKHKRAAAYFGREGEVGIERHGLSAHMLQIDLAGGSQCDSCFLDIGTKS